MFGRPKNRRKSEGSGFRFPGALVAKFGIAAGQDSAPAKAKSVILLWMQGAASQIDSWDPKPGTATGARSSRSTRSAGGR